MTTKKAFEKFINDQELIEKSGINANTIKSYRKRWVDGTITVDAMERALSTVAKKTEHWTFKKK